MTNHWTLTLAEFLVTYWIHSSLFVGAALIAGRIKLIKSDKQGEWLVKSAMVSGVITCLLIVSNFSPASILISNLNAGVSVKAQPLTQTPDIQKVTKSDSIKHDSFEQNLSASETVAPVMSTGLSETEPQLSLQTKPEKLASNTPWYLSTDIRALSLWLSFFWLSGVIILAISKFYQNYNLRRLLNCREKVVDTAVIATFSHLVTTAAFEKKIYLSQSGCINSPLVFSTNEVIVPENFATSFSAKQREAALAHELAHLKRKDTLWLKLGLIIEVLFFIQPLNNLLNRQIHQIAEQRSDRLAAKWTGDPQALAEALSVVAHINLQSSQTKMVFAMKSKKSNLLNRVENLLIKSSGSTNRFSVVAGAFLAVGVLVTAPGIAIQTVNAETTKAKVAKPKAVKSVSKVSQKGSHMHIENGDTNHFRMTNHHDDVKFQVEGKLEGKMRFNDAETAIIEFPEDSELEIIVDDGDERKLVIERDDDDPVEYRYYEDGSKKAFDDDAKTWFASIIPEFLRVTGINAKERVARIKSKSGDEGVLDEIELIRSDFIAGLYFKNLFGQSQLSDENIMRSVKLTSTIGSDFEHAAVLKALVKTQEITKAEHWLAVTEMTSKIGSDFEQANVLKSFIPKLPESEEIQTAFFNAAEEIGSDFELKNVFSAFLKEQQFGDQGLIAMFKVAKSIGSDFELSSLLNEAAEQVDSSPEVFAAYIKLAESIGSDFEMRRAFSKLLKVNIDKKHLIKMLHSASDEIGSDHELANLLMDTINSQSLDDEVSTAIREATRMIGSSHERGRVLDNLNNKNS